MDVIAEHRLRGLALDPARLASLGEAERAQAIYQAFLDRVPYENLSNNRAVLENPEHCDAWPRATDRVLRDCSEHGLGGTSFSLAYTLRDLFHGAGLNAHTTLAYNLVTEQPHAAVVLYMAGAPLLFDPAILMRGAVPVRPGGVLDEALGQFTLVPRCGATLTLQLEHNEALRRSRPHRRAPADDTVWAALEPRGSARAIYSILPVPAPPPSFRQAWIASFHRGRLRPLRLARRQDDTIWRYGERPRSLEILTPAGRRVEPLPPRPVKRLAAVFRVDEICLEHWFASTPR